MLRHFFLLLFILLPTTALADCRPSDNSCDFYSCQEQQRSCGSRGYWMNFGEKYCKKFLYNEENFSPRVQSWLQDVRLCLQERTLELTQQSSCKNLYREAMHSHVGCYVDTGFCDLSFLERSHVFWYLRYALRSSNTWLEAHQLFKACRQFKQQTSIH